MKILIIIAIILGLAGLSVGAYFLINYFNKRKNRLFKNEQEKLNIINFIKDSKNKGMNKKRIKSMLKSAGWRRGQISYGFRNLGKAGQKFSFS